MLRIAIMESISDGLINGGAGRYMDLGGNLGEVCLHRIGIHESKVCT